MGWFTGRGGSATELGHETFEQFAAAARERLQRAFVAAYGPERGADATAEALGYAWEHWRRVRRMDNPVGYLYRVGQTRTRPRRAAALPGWNAVRAHEPVFEPGLVDAIAQLSEQQRVAAVLVHGYEWTLREVADLMGVTISTVQTHLERALAKLRAALEVADDV